MNLSIVKSRITNKFQLLVHQQKLVLVTILMAFLLSGCIEYDVGVKFDHPNSGELVQHIRLGERLTSFSGESVYEWLNSIERRTRKLEGKTRRISKEEIIVTIPFSNGHELQSKFNEFFNPDLNQKQKSKADQNTSDLPKIESNLLLFQNNFILLVRNRLVYDLDLRSLALISNNGNVLTNTASILDLDFSLKTPWGAKSIQTENSLPPQRQPHQLIWQLTSGELNHIEAVFWLPSPLGIGTLLIILFVWGGLYLRYTFMPAPNSQLTSSST